MAPATRDRNEIITSQLPRDELLGLLDTMAPGNAQRVTAEMAIPNVPEYDGLADEPPAPATTSGELDVVVRFTSPASDSRPTLALAPLRRPDDDVGPHVLLPPPPPAVLATSSQPALLLPTPSALIAPPDRRRLPRWAIVAVSTALTLFLAGLVALVA
jgi:hypothetical protein